jgi:hypothetical protein
VRWRGGDGDGELAIDEYAGSPVDTEPEEEPEEERRRARRPRRRRAAAAAGGAVDDREAS